MTRIASVILPLPLPEAFDYAEPEGMGLQVGVIGRTHQRAGRDVMETHRLTGFAQCLKFFGSPVTHHRMMVRRGLQILANRDHLDVMGA